MVYCSALKRTWVSVHCRNTVAIEEPINKVSTWLNAVLCPFNWDLSRETKLISTIVHCLKTRYKSKNCVSGIMEMQVILKSIEEEE